MVSKLSLLLEAEKTIMEWVPPGSEITGERGNLNVQDYKSNFTKPQFRVSVNKGKEHIKAGDISGDGYFPASLQNIITFLNKTIFLSDKNKIITLISRWSLKNSGNLGQFFRN